MKSFFRLRFDSCSGALRLLFGNPSSRLRLRFGCCSAGLRLGVEAQPRDSRSTPEGVPTPSGRNTEAESKNYQGKGI